MRDSSSKHARQLVAQQAARMMADDGVADYAHAKRKAARQLGFPEDGCLPTNAEIDQAIRDYHEIFHCEAHSQNLRRLRLGALDVMRQFEQFDPHLTGGVLDGTAGRYAKTEIFLFADSLKEVELFLLNHRIPYRLDEKPYRTGQDRQMIPVFLLETDIGEVQLVVFGKDEMRSLPRKSRTGGMPDYASLSSLESQYSVN